MIGTMFAMIGMSQRNNGILLRIYPKIGFHLNLKKDSNGNILTISLRDIGRKNINHIVVRMLYNVLSFKVTKCISKQ